MRNLFYAAVCLLSVGLCGCGSASSSPPRTPPDQSGRVTITEGVWGQVWLLQGNFMPGSATGTVTPVRRTIHFYEPTTADQTTSATDPPGRFYSEVRSRQVATVESDEKGFFQLNLPPGRYSYFVREEQGYLYAYTSYEEDANTPPTINPIDVRLGKVTKLQIRIDYEAAY